MVRRYSIVAATVVLSTLFAVGVVSAATTISTNISTGGTLTVTGAVTTAGDGTFGDAATDLNIFTGTLQASTTALFTSGFTTYGNLTVDKLATTTVTFNQAGINFDSGTFVIDPNSDRLGVGTSSPFSALSVHAAAGVTGFSVGSSTATYFTVNHLGRTGVASTSPYVALGVTGTTTSSAGAVIGAVGSPVTQLLFGTCSVDFGAIAASTTVMATCTATGVTTTDKVFVTPASLENQIILVSASSTAADTIQVAAYNTGATVGSINPAAATWSWMGIR